MKRFLLVTICSAMLTACVGSQPLEGPTDTPAANQTPVESTDGAAGGSTTAGNPGAFNIEDASGLVLLPIDGPDSQPTNLKAILNNGDVVDLLEFAPAQPTQAQGFQLIKSANAATQPENIQVKNVFVNKGHSLVVLFDKAITLKGTTCHFWYVRFNAEYDCISKEVSSLQALKTTQESAGIPGGHVEVQFDAAGKVYYVKDHNVYLWDPSSPKTAPQALIVKEIDAIEDFLVGPGGYVWLRTYYKEKPIFFARRPNDTYPVVELEDVSLFQTAQYDADSKEGLLVVAAKQDDGQGIFSITYNDLGLMATMVPGVSSEIFPLIDLESTDAALWFGQSKVNSVNRILPSGGSVAFNVDEDAVRYFTNYGAMMYYVGQTSLEDPVFKRVELDFVPGGPIASTENLIGERRLDVHLFDTDQKKVFFDSTDTNDGNMFVGQIDLEKNLELKELLPVKAKAIKVLSLY